MEVKKETYSRQLRIDFSRCKLCPYRAKSMFLIIGHLRLHRLRTSEDAFNCHSNPPQNYKCKKCSFEADLKTTLQRHIDSAHCGKTAPAQGVKTYTCKGAANDATCGLFMCCKCSFETTNRNYFQAHSIMRHLQDVKGECYSCDQCGFVTDKRHTLMTHTLRKHSDPDDGFCCDRCPAKFLTRMQLELHMDRHFDVRDYHEVGKHAFTRLKPSRNGVKYKCNFCSFGEMYKSCIRRHVLIEHSRRKCKEVVRM